MALVVDTTCLHIFPLHFFALVRFVGQVCRTNFYFLFYTSSKHVRALWQFYCIFSCYLPPNQPGLRWLNNCREYVFNHLTRNGRNIPFVNSVKYLAVIFDKKVTWRLHIEMIEAKAFRIFIRIHSLFKSERLSTNIKMTLHKALIRSTISYVCSTWEFAADNHLLKLQRLQNKVHQPIGNFPRRMQLRDLQKAFKLPYIYDYTTKLCRQQAVIQSHENENVRNTGQGEGRHRKYKRRSSIRPFKWLDCCCSRSY
jgi:hypothetical protein